MVQLTSVVGPQAHHVCGGTTSSSRLWWVHKLITSVVGPQAHHVCGGSTSSSRLWWVQSSHLWWYQSGSSSSTNGGSGTQYPCGIPLLIWQTYAMKTISSSLALVIHSHHSRGCRHKCSGNKCTDMTSNLNFPLNFQFRVIHLSPDY